MTQKKASAIATKQNAVQRAAAKVAPLRDVRGNYSPTMRERREYPMHASLYTAAQHAAADLILS